MPFDANCCVHTVGVKACMDRMEPVDEQKFEVATDVHGVTEGPRLGRQRVLNKVAFFYAVIHAVEGFVTYWKLPIRHDT